MAAPTVNGWTSASLLPSYAVVSHILGGAGGPAGIPPAVAGAVPGATGVMTGDVPHPLGITGPGAPPVAGYAGAPVGGPGPILPPGWTTGGGPAMGGLPGGRNDWSNLPTPEQSYALANMGLTSAMTMTPQEFAAQQYQNAVSSFGGFGSFALDPNRMFAQVPGSGAANQARAQIYGSIFPTASRNSYAFGAPAPIAPAPTPAWGYPTGYGQQTPGMQSGWRPPGTMAGMGGFG